MRDKLVLPDGTKNEIKDMILSGLEELIVAYQLAEHCGATPIEFAVEISKLYELRISDSFLRWLIKKEFVLHAIEISLPASATRMFHEGCGMVFRSESCFYMSASGFHHFCTSSDSPTGVEELDPAVTNRVSEFLPDVRSVQSSNEKPKPIWDADRQELRFNGDLVKRYRHPSKNQIAVLNCFQEEEWPARIDDPLPPTPGSNSRRKLNDTVKALNNHQKNKLLRFRCDGTGEGVIWETVDQLATFTI